MARTDTHRRAVAALAQSLRDAQPDLSWSNENYLAQAEDNLIPALREAYWPRVKEQLLAGDGNELAPSNGAPPKFCAAHSSSALAINSFAPWIDRSKELHLCQLTDFDGKLEFEAKCFNGVGPRASNLDALLADGIATYGVESKLAEWIRPSGSKGEFSPVYAALEDSDPRKKTSWFRAMEAITGGVVSFEFLDAAQLIKHFYGLAFTYPGTPVRVIYIYWEPTNASEFEAFAKHRAEIEQFSAMVKGEDDLFLFESISYPAHWRELAAIDPMPDWLPDHLAALRARYEIAI